MLGQKTLYDAYLNPSTESSKGRSAVLVGQRNHLLSARFYYHMHYCRLRFDDILHHLQREFFLSEQRIVDVLKENQTILDNYMEEKPEIKQLKKEFSWFVWD